MTNFEIYQELGRTLGVTRAYAELEEMRLVALGALSMAIAEVVALKDPLDPQTVDSVASELFQAASSIRSTIAGRLEAQVLKEATDRDDARWRNSGAEPCPGCGVIGGHICHHVVHAMFHGVDGYDPIALSVYSSPFFSCPGAKE